MIELKTKILFWCTFYCYQCLEFWFPHEEICFDQLYLKSKKKMLKNKVVPSLAYQLCMHRGSLLPFEIGQKCTVTFPFVHSTQCLNLNSSNVIYLIYTRTTTQQSMGFSTSLTSALIQWITNKSYLFKDDTITIWMIVTIFITFFTVVGATFLRCRRTFVILLLIINIILSWVIMIFWTTHHNHFSLMYSYKLHHLIFLSSHTRSSNTSNLYHSQEPDVYTKRETNL